MSNRKRAAITPAIVRRAADVCGPWGMALKEYARQVNCAYRELSRAVAAYRRERT